MDDYSNLARALGYNPAYDALKRVNEMHLDRFNSMFRDFSAAMNPNLQIAGLANSALMNYPTSTIEDAIRKMSSASHLEKAIGSAAALNWEAIVRRMNLSSTFQEMASAASVINQITDHQNQLSRQIVSSIHGAFDSTKIALEALRPQISIFQDWALTHSAVFDRFARFWEEFEANYNITEYRAVRVLKKYNWFVSPSLPESFVYDAVKLGRKRGNKLREMNSLFWDYFSDNNFKNLNSMVRSWSGNPLFKGRMKILRDCVATLRQAKPNTNPSNVVVPTLIAQIDGVLTKFRKRKGLVFKTHGSQNQLHELRVWFEAETTNQDVLSEQMLEVANYILFSILFQTASYGKPLANPFTLSRHKIMHGEFLTYGRRANAIRAFLILDFLAALE